MTDRIRLLRFLKIASRYGGIHGKGLVHMAPWLFKTTFLAPFNWYELAKYNKTIRSHQIEKQPVFILGYYRSGTTFLQRMFMQDEQFGHTSLFQTVLPEIMLSCENWMTPILERSSRLLGLKNHFHRLPLTWKDFPGEEDVSLTTLIKQQASHWTMLFPESGESMFDKNTLLEKLTREEMKNWKSSYQFILKKISLKNRGKQLVLKNPPNTARIRTLLELFPDAKFIHIMRDPLEVFSSMQRFWDVVLKNYALGKITTIDKDKLIIDSYQKIMSAFLDQKSLIPPNNFAEIRYEDFISHPVDAMKIIYSKLGLPGFEEAVHPMKSFAVTQSAYAKLHHQPGREIREMIGEKWKRMTEYWESLNKSI